MGLETGKMPNRYRMIHRAAVSATGGSTVMGYASKTPHSAARVTVQEDCRKVILTPGRNDITVTVTDTPTNL